MCTASPARHLLDFRWSAQNRKKSQNTDFLAFNMMSSAFQKSATIARNCRKSPTDTGNIPVFVRLQAESFLDTHRV
jgi:hypothetical protein